MKYRDCMVAYNAGGPIVAGPHPDDTGWSNIFDYTVGACYLKAKEASDKDNIIQMLLEFHHAVVRDGVPVDEAHRAFSAIDEYRDVLAEDIAAARNN